MTTRKNAPLLTALSIGIMGFSGFLLLACFVNRPQKSSSSVMPTAAILFSGSQISLAILACQNQGTKRKGKEDS